MMNGERLKAPWHCCHGFLAAIPAGLSQKQSMCGAFPARRKAASGCPVDAWPQCHQEWRHLHYAQADEAARLVWTANAQCGSERAGSVRPDLSHPPRIAARLQPVGLHALPHGLRPEKDRRKTRVLPHDGLDDGRRPRRQADGEEAGHVEASTKNSFAYPATGRSLKDRPATGQSDQGETPQFAYFVPPRDKTPGFSLLHRPATGHLYRLAISLPFLSAQSRGVKEHATPRNAATVTDALPTRDRRVPVASPLLPWEFVGGLTVEMLDYANQIESKQQPSGAEKLSKPAVATARDELRPSKDPRTHRAKPKELNP